MACDFFGTDDDIAHGDALTRAWALRQRDTKQALALLDALPADLAAPIRGRAELVRAEAAWLFNRLSDAAAHLAAARAAFAAAADEAGLGDADLLDAALCDQAGGDRDAAMRAAHEHYRRAGDATRERIAATGCGPSPLSPEAWATRVQGDITRWKAMANERNIRAD